MKLKIVLFILLLLFGVGVMTYQDFQLQKQEIQQSLLNSLENEEITKEQAIELSKELREKLAIEYCEINDCKIIRKINGT